MRSWMIAYLAGVVVFHLWGALLSAGCSIFLLILSLVTFLVSKRIRWLSLFFMAIVWSSSYSEMIKSKVIEAKYEGVDLYASGYVCSIPKRKELVTVFELCDTSIHLIRDNSPVATGLRIKLSWYTRDLIKLDGSKEFVVRLKKPHGMVNPYGFLYEKWLFRKGISAVGYVKKATAYQDNQLNQSGCSSGWPGCQIAELRMRVSSSLDALSSDLKYVALIKALSIGYRGDIDSNQWAILKGTGTQHLIAISGLHIGLVFGLVIGFVAMLWRVLKRGVADAVFLKTHYIKPISSILFALGGALIYAAMAGFLVSTQRALIMLLVYSLCGLSRQRLHPNTRLLIAAVTILLIDPNAILDFGLWLSFFAVWALFFAFSIAVKSDAAHKMMWLRKSALMQWIIFVGLCPVLLAAGIGLSYTSLIANFVAIPLIGLIAVPLVFAGLLVMPFSDWLAESLLYLADKSIQLLFYFLELFNKFELLEVEYASVFLIVSAAMLVLAILLLPTLKWIKVWLVIVLGLVFWFKPTISHQKATELVVLDVGQGLSFAAVNGRRALVYDTGPAYRHGSAAQRSLIPYLKAKGVTHIDLMIISHGDDDHSGGLKDVESAFTVGALITGQPKRLKTKSRIKQCEDGKHQTTDWYSMQFFYVPGFSNRSLSANNHSCAVRIQVDGGSILLMGDVEKQAESLIVKRYGDKLKSDVLVAGHHGSKNATSSYLLNNVDPDLVIFSTGYRNRFHHPHPDVIERVKDSGARFLNTAADGAVVIQKGNGDDWLFETQRERKKAFWLF